MSAVYVDREGEAESRDTDNYLRGVVLRKRTAEEAEAQRLLVERRRAEQERQEAKREGA